MFQMMTRIERATAKSAEFAAAFDDAPVAFAEEGVGFRGRGGGLAERPFEIRVAPAGLAAALDRSGLDGAWAQFGPRHQVRGGGEPAHVEPDLGENDLRESRADAGNLVSRSIVVDSRAPSAPAPAPPR